MMFLIFALLVCLSFQTKDTPKSLAAMKLMEDNKYSSSNEEEDLTVVEPGYHKVVSNEKYGHLSFYLDSYVLNENHPAVHKVDAKYGLAAMNLDKLPEDAESVVMEGLDPEDKNTLALVRIKKPLADQGSYKRTDTRAVYEVESVSIFDVMQDISVRVPFRTLNKDGLTYKGKKTVSDDNDNDDSDSEENDDEEEKDNHNLTKWIPKITIGDDADLDVTATFNWDEGEEYPGAIFDEVPMLIGGAQISLAGDFIFDFKDNHLKAGVEIDLSLDAEVGLHLDHDDAFEAELKKSFGPWMTNFPALSWDVLVLSIGLQVGFGVDLELSIKGIIDVYLDYIYEMKLDTPNSIFIGYDGSGESSISKDSFEFQFIKPDATLVDGVINSDNLLLQLTLEPEVYVSPYFRAEFAVSILKASAGIGVNVGVDLDAKMTLGIDTVECTSLPYVYIEDATLDLKPYAHIVTDEFKVWNITVCEEKDFGKVYFNGMAWEISPGCFNDPLDIHQVTIHANSNKSIMVQMNSLTSDDDKEPTRVEVTTSTERCVFYNYNDGDYCVLNDIDEEDYIYVKFYYSSIFKLFGYINQYVGHYSTRIKDLGDTRVLTESDEDLEQDNTWKKISTYNISLTLFDIPEFSDLPSAVDNETGETFYSMLRIPAGYDGQVATILNLVKESEEEDDQSVWTNGENYLTYYGVDQLKDAIKKNYYFDTNWYEQRKVEMTKIDNNGNFCDLGMIYCIGSGDKDDIEEDCKALSGDTIVDVSGDQYNTYPIDNNNSEENSDNLKKYTLNFVCDGSTTPYMYVHASWNNSPDHYDLYDSDLCQDSELGSHDFEVTKSTTHFNVKRADYEIPIIYEPDEQFEYYGYRVNSQTYAAANKVDYAADLSLTINKIDYQVSEEETFGSEYGIIIIEVTSQNLTTDLSAGIIIKVSDDTKIDFLKAYDELGDNTYIVESIIAHNTDSDGDHYFLNIPFRFKDDTTSATFTLNDLFSVATNESSCNTDNEVNEVSLKSGSAKIGCVLKHENTRVSSTRTQSLIYTYTSSQGTLVHGEAEISENSTYDIYYIPSPSSDITIKFTFADYVYIPDSTRPEAKMSKFIGNNYSNGVYSIIRSNGCYKTIFTVGDNTITLMEDEEVYISSQENTEFGEALKNGNSGSSLCYCEEHDSTNGDLLYPKACLFSINENNGKMYLLHSDKPAGIRSYGTISNSEVFDLSAYNNAQFVTFPTGIYYAYDEDGEYTYEYLESDKIIVNINYNDEISGTSAARIKVTSSDGTKLLPISYGIFEDEEIMDAIFVEDAPHSHSYLGTDGILFIEKQYVKTEIDGSKLINICYPYVATEVEISEGCSNGEYSNDNGVCTSCDSGHYCLGGVRMTCNAGSIPVNERNKPVNTGASGCLSESETATSTTTSSSSSWYIVAILSVCGVIVVAGIVTGVVIMLKRKEHDYHRLE